MESTTQVGFLPAAGLQRLLDALIDAGYACIGPTVTDGAIAYAPLTEVGQLPRDWRDQQGPGRYLLERDATDGRYFAWANGAQALKPLVYPPRESLWRVERRAEGLDFQPGETQTRRRAVIGVRACDIAALRLLDRHFLEGLAPDPSYQARRQGLFIVAVHCTHPAATCFCQATGDGPQACAGYDLALGEIDTGFVIEAGSSAGAAVLGTLQLEPASPAQRDAAAQAQAAAAARQQRRLDPARTRDAAREVLRSELWSRVSETCLSCGNCTQVCPTCFCYAEHETGGLDLDRSEHLREWDSCFTQGHSYIHGLTVRAETPQRYRQWFVHKLSTWYQQYGRSGCVGCGRCITWCPVGIDITAVAAAVVDEAASALAPASPASDPMP